MRIQKVELEPMPKKKVRLTLLVSPVEVEGTLIKFSESTSWSLVVNESTLNESPEKVVTWKDGEDEVAVVLCVQVSAPFEPVMESIIEGGKKVIKALGDRGQAAVIPFGESIKKGQELAPLTQAIGKLGRLTPDDQLGPQPRLQGALKLAIDLLAEKEASLPERRLRKMIVVVSDGFAENQERKKFTDLAKKAAERGIVIHSIAFAPLEEKAPLLNLGQLSKVTHGTLRWAKQREFMDDQFATLTDEIINQPAISFIIPEKVLEGGASVKLVMDNLTTNNAMPVPDTPTCKLEECAPGYACDTDHCVAPKKSFFSRFGWLLWILLGLGALVAAFLVFKRFAAKMKREAELAAEAQQLQQQQLVPPGAIAPGPGVPGYTGMGMQAPVLPGVPMAAGVNANAAAEAAARAALLAAQVQAQGAAPSGGKGGKAPKLASYDPKMLQQQAAAMQAAAAAAAAQAKFPHHVQQPQHVPPPQQPQYAQPPQQAPQPQHAPQAAAGPCLMVMSGSQKGMRIPLMHGFMIGKAQDVHFQVNDGFASGHHAQLMRDSAGNYTIADLNSTNGTFVNGARIRAQPLAHGSLIQVGQMEFRYLVQ